MTKGNSPTARAGGRCNLKACKITILQPMLNAAASGPTPNTPTRITPEAALEVHTSGTTKGRPAHGQVEARANISKPLTTRVGERKRRQHLQTMSVSAATRS